MPPPISPNVISYLLFTCTHECMYRILKIWNILSVSKTFEYYEIIKCSVINSVNTYLNWQQESFDQNKN